MSYPANNKLKGVHYIELKKVEYKDTMAPFTKSHSIYESLCGNSYYNPTLPNVTLDSDLMTCKRCESKFVERVLEEI